MEAAVNDNLPDGLRSGEFAHRQNVPAITPVRLTLADQLDVGCDHRAEHETAAARNGVGIAAGGRPRKSFATKQIIQPWLVALRA
ncbi:hypothetical protein JQ629_11040 [Bradyrhizobium sp. AUGA SZCCT0222]|uniref:hypothetical protein n=1 Tax=Bradyrhizobium sp. AUGA SZCCT0222 TaxID=2807668 RepID=UPI001BAD610A|nr:hypothetical protein [Bradyrhizobium sp. AUGA SZCCT0222]MBR1268043.1 hypothetical protein [Bradyrhizobium sp. AUGA SZCCT0222]